MAYVVAALLVCGMLAWFFATWRCIDAENWLTRWLWGGVAVAITVGGLGAIIQGDMAANARGPCLRYETIMMFNAATKTVMPVRHCVERGEWVRP